MEASIPGDPPGRPLGPDGTARAHGGGATRPPTPRVPRRAGGQAGQQAHVPHGEPARQDPGGHEVLVVRLRPLPVRGQRTRTNARTRKGPKKTVAGKKSVKSLR